MKAPPHPQQSARLKALHSYEILDTDREQEFDEVAELAAKLCETPVGIISLVEIERQWFKAEVGLGVHETPIEMSICSHALLGGPLIEIEDTTKDPRTADNPLCVGDRALRFYAGALLVSNEGLPIGTLCVLDHRPRRLTPLQRDALRVLAGQVMARLDLRRTLREAETLRQEVDHRVKNSLHLLSSLIRLQASSSGAPDVAEALATVDSRIQVIAELHDQLYRTEAGSRIDLGRYLENLAAALADVAPRDAAIETELDEVTVNSRQAAAVGTLINELATNAFKHAFPGGHAGRVRLSLRAAEDGLVTLEFGDDGVGLGDGAGARGKGLGMKIASTLCRQLGSELEIDSSRAGATFRVRFAPGA